MHFWRTVAAALAVAATVTPAFGMGDPPVPPDLHLGGFAAELPDGWALVQGQAHRVRFHVSVTNSVDGSVVDAATVPLRFRLMLDNQTGFPIYADLGTVQFPREAIGAGPQVFELPLNTNRVRETIATAQAQADDMHFLLEATLDPTSAEAPRGLVDEGGDPNAELDAGLVGAPKLRALTTNAFFGAARATIDRLHTWPSPLDGLCPGGVGFRPRQFGVTWIPSAVDPTWPRISYGGFEDICLLIEPSAGDPHVYDVRVKTGTTNAVTFDHQMGGHPIALRFRLGSSGVVVEDLKMTLPPRHSVHEEACGERRGVAGCWPRSFGSPVVTFDDVTVIGNDLGQIVAQTLTPLYLHAGALPFYLRVPNLVATLGDVGGNCDERAVSVYDLSFHDRDWRRPGAGSGLGDAGIGEALVSNAARFSVPRVPSGMFSLSPTGVEAALRFPQGVATSHFPRVRTTWQAVDARLIDGRVQPGGPDLPSSHTFTLASRCADCAANGGLERTLTLGSAQAGAEAFDAFGTVVSRIDALGAEAFWGPPVTKDGVKRAVFERTGDAAKPGVVVVPGYEAAGTDTASAVVADFLLASFDVEADGPDGRWRVARTLPPGDAEAKRGNFFMAGVTVGPEILADANRQPAAGLGALLTGSTTSIGFRAGGGGRTFSQVVHNEGTKLVIRPGGVTGVFNTDRGVLPQPVPQVYGYETGLERFAFRMVANRLDTTSWFDGFINLPDPAGFKTPFTSLALECTGDVGGGHVAMNAGAQRLAGWKAPFDLTSIAFAPVPPAGQCSDADRTLRVGKDVQVHALTKRVSVTAAWQRDGAPNNASPAVIGGDPSNEVDRRGASIAGFPLEIESDGARFVWEAGRGWFGVKALVPLRFWNALDDVFVRLENQEGRAAPTYLTTGAYGTTPGQFDAVYEWVAGATISLPIKWRPDGRAIEGGASSAAFEGEVKNESLWVLDAKAAADFVMPERTKISFGVSADLTKIADVPAVQVDLKDPASVRRIDGFLGTLGVPLNIDGGAPDCRQSTGKAGPVCAAVGGLQAPSKILLEQTADGFKTAIEGLLRTALKADAVNQVFVDAANALRGVQSIPLQITGQVFDTLRTQVDALLGALTGPFDDAVATVASQLATKAEALKTATGAAADTARAELLAVIEKLDAVEGGLNTAAEAAQAITGRVVEAKTLVTTLAGGADAKITTGRHMICKVRHVIGRDASAYCAAEAGAGRLSTAGLPSLKDVIGSCPNTEAGRAASSNPVLAHLRTITNAAKLVDQLANSTFLTAVIDVAGKLLGVDVGGLKDAQKAIGNLAKDIRTRIDGAAQKVGDLVCVKVNTVLDKVDAKLFTPADTALQGAGAAVGTVATAVTGALTALNDPIVTAKTKLGGVASKLKKLSGDLKAMTTGGTALGGAEVQAALDEAAAAFGGTVTTFSQLSRDAVADVVRTPIFTVIDAAQSAVGAGIRDLVNTLPFPSADDMREYIIGQIMNSEFMNEAMTVVHNNFVFVTKSVNDLTVRVLDQINNLVKEITTKINDRIRQLAEGATSALKELPIKAAKLDGYAVIGANSLERLHIEGQVEMKGASSDGDTKFGGALDIISWGASNKGKACATPDYDLSSTLDAKIAAFNVPISIGSGDLKLKKVELGFTLGADAVTKDLEPIGLFGGIETSGSLKFSSFTLRDILFDFGAGALEAYLGARCSAQFNGLDVIAAFLVGKACDNQVFNKYDPEVASFIGLGPTEPFAGVYVRGGASIPIYSVGCFFTVGAGAEVGAWVLSRLAGLNIGGLVGGSVWGKALCLASLRGGVRLLGNYYNSVMTFQGTGYGVGGIGFSCDPETWTSIARSRDDGGCATADAQFTATYDDGFQIQGMDVDGIF